MGRRGCGSILGRACGNLCGKQVGLEMMIDGVYGVKDSQMDVGEPDARGGRGFLGVANDGRGSDGIPVDNDILCSYTGNSQKRECERNNEPSNLQLEPP